MRCEHPRSESQSPRHCIPQGCVLSPPSPCDKSCSGDFSGDFGSDSSPPVFAGVAGMGCSLVRFSPSVVVGSSPTCIPIAAAAPGTESPSSFVATESLASVMPVGFLPSAGGSRSKSSVCVAGLEVSSLVSAGAATVPSPDVDEGVHYALLLDTSLFVSASSWAA